MGEREKGVRFRLEYLPVQIKETTNPKVIPTSCPLYKPYCIDQLGKYECKCEFYKHHYTDTKSVGCTFDECTEDEKLLFKNLYLKMIEIDLK